MAATHRKLGAVAAVLLLSAAGCSGSGPGEQAKSGGDRVAFGVLAPLSGPHSAQGRDAADGARMAAADLNVRGGVIGKQAAAVVVDDRCTAVGAEQGAARLRNTDRVAGAVGGICDADASAAARSFSRAGTPFLITTANSPSLVSETRTPTAYLAIGTPYQEALATSHWLAVSLAQQLAVVAEGTTKSRFLARKLISLANPPKVVSYQQAAPDPRRAARVALASKPDVVYWAGSAAGAGRLVAALRAAGYRGRFVASAESESPAFPAAGGRSADGAYVVTTASPQNLPAAAGWARRFEKAYGHAPGRDALQAYDGVRALAQAVTQTGQVDHAANSNQLAFLDETYSTFLGPGLQFARDHTPQEDNHIVLRVRNGAFRVATTLRSSNG